MPITRSAKIHARPSMRKTRFTSRDGNQATSSRRTLPTITSGDGPTMRAMLASATQEARTAAALRACGDKPNTASNAPTKGRVIRSSMWAARASYKSRGAANLVRTSMGARPGPRGSARRVAHHPRVLGRSVPRHEAEGRVEVGAVLRRELDLRAATQGGVIEGEADER